MTTISSLFSSFKPLTLTTLENKVAELHASGAYVRALNATEKFRFAAERDPRIDEDQRLLQVGAACALSLCSLHSMASAKEGGERRDTLFALFASYRAMHEAFSAVGYGSGKSFETQLGRFRKLAATV